MHSEECPASSLKTKNVLSWRRKRSIQNRQCVWRCIWLALWH